MFVLRFVDWDDIELNLVEDFREINLYLIVKECINVVKI